MQIDSFTGSDLDGFLELAGQEGWVCGRWEFDFLFRAFPSGCLVARAGGRAAGFVTAVRYGESGWIGNLIVREGMRGQGVGTLLMKQALSALAAAGVRTVWLTASRLGRPIYEALGFRAVDMVNRWVGTGIGGASAGREAISRDDMLAIDQAGWGDRRDALLDQVAARGRVLSAAGCFLVCQPCVDGVQIGPWGGGGTGAALLLGHALAATGAGEKVCLDVPIRNTGQTALLLGAGFTIRGSTILMYRGESPAYVPERIFALASMGSMG